MKYLEIIPNFLSMYGVFTSPYTSHVRQEMSITCTKVQVGKDQEKAQSEKDLAGKHLFRALKSVT